MKPYTEQLEAVESAFEHGRGIISAVTGSGKSLIAALIIQRMQVRTLIVVPSLSLKHQLSVSMIGWFGESKVGKNRDIYVENVQALSKKVKLKYDLLIIDEFHHSAAASYRDLNKLAWSDIFYRIGLSGTPFRNDEEESILLESILGNIIYEIDFNTAVSKKMIVPVEAYYIEMPKIKSDLYTWPEVYSKLVVENHARNNLISELLFKLENANKSTLCLVKEIAHGEKLSAKTGIPFVNGANDDSRDFIRQFNNCEITTLIGTTGVIGEGIDTKPCEYVIVAGLGKAKSSFQQQIGRAVRNFPGKESAKIIIVKDASHKYLLTHFKEQCKILKEQYGITPQKLEI